jgi:hypothetical protein
MHSKASEKRKQTVRVIRFGTFHPKTMDLRPNGIDIFYIDKSERHPLAVTSVVRIPFLRPNPNQ